MSTHPHLVYSDPDGTQPRFKAEFHRLFALCIKAIRGWPEEVFNKSKGGEHEPLTPEAMIEAIAYLIANPCAAFAVRRARDWPGPKTLPRDIGTRVITAKRPNAYFDPANPQWPEELELKLTMPPALEAAYGAVEARGRIAARVAVLEAEARVQSKHRGIPFRGFRRVLRTPHTVRARSYEVFGTLNPRFSAGGDLEVARRKVGELRAFDEAYDRALAHWIAGQRRVIFPHGTWWMRVHHGARCHPPP